jgi:beta,beta-carotene 9',10'-dioxygenase
MLNGEEVMNRPPYYLGFTTLASETSVEELPVRGLVPAWLTGTLVRNGPAKFEVGDQKYNHWFDGLAMLHKFAFAAGRVSYANRYLRSRAYEEATAKGKISQREFATDPCRSLFQRVASWFSPTFSDNGSVNIAKFADAVVALTETRLPVRFDPDTLATLGVCEYDRQIPGPLSTAHPHFDHARGRHYNYMLDFGWRSKYRLFGIDRETGRQSVLATIPVERPAYMHSFGMTERYLILAEFPLVVNPLRLLFSGQPFIRNYRWEPDRGVRFHVVEKEGGRVVRTARAAAFFAFHHVNAFEDGDEVVVDIVTNPDAAVIDQLYLDRLRSAEPVAATGKLTRFRIGAGEDVVGERLSEVPLEFPRFAYRRLAGRPYRYVYGAGNEVPGNFIDSLVKLDLEGGTASSWHEEGCYPGEPVFVAAPGAANEDGGVILSVVLDARKAASFLLILDASTCGELGRAEAPHHIPFGFHGNYLAEASRSAPVQHSDVVR